MRVRPLVIAPAHVHAHLLRRHIGERAVQGLDVELRALEEFGLGEILKRGVPRHGKIGTVDLQDEAGRDDRLVFLAHRRGDRLDIGLVRGIIAVGQEGRDHAGRSGVEESFDRTGGRDRAPHIVEIALKAGAVAQGDRADAGHALEAPRAGQQRHLAPQLGKRRDIEMRLRRLGRALLGKAAQPVLHIGGIADLAGLAVADDVDAEVDLPLHDVGDGLLHRRDRRRPINFGAGSRVAAAGRAPPRCAADCRHASSGYALGSSASGVLALYN